MMKEETDKLGSWQFPSIGQNLIFLNLQVQAEIP